MHLALGVVEAAGAGPAVRAAEDRSLPCVALHPARARRRRGRAPRPRHLDEASVPRPGRGPGPPSSQLLRIAGRRTRNRATSGAQHMQADGRGIGVSLERMQGRTASPSSSHSTSYTPQWAGGKGALIGHGVCLRCLGDGKEPVTSAGRCRTPSPAGRRVRPAGRTARGGTARRPFRAHRAWRRQDDEDLVGLAGREARVPQSVAARPRGGGHRIGMAGVVSHSPSAR